MHHQWRRAAAIVGFGILGSSLLGGCAASGPKPSAACGGFHLFIGNRTSAPLEVRLNGKEALTAQPSGDTTIYQYGPGGVSAMPWKVEIVDPVTGAVLATRDVSEGSGDRGARIEINEAQAGSAPAVGDVQSAGGC